MCRRIAECNNHGVVRGIQCLGASVGSEDHFHSCKLAGPVSTRRGPWDACSEHKRCPMLAADGFYLRASKSRPAPLPRQQ
ncbi:unnamed protein product [Ixodes persulcatus]